MALRLDQAQAGGGDNCLQLGVNLELVDHVPDVPFESVEPIWGDQPPVLLAEFVSSGGRAVITCVELARLDDSWLGRITDEQFVADIRRRASMSAARTANTTRSPSPAPSSSGR